MTAPFEIEEPEPIPFSSLVHVRCSRCGAPKAVCALGQERRALCAGCMGSGVVLDAAAREAASRLRTARRYPYVPPRDPTLQECADRDQCPICMITKFDPNCTFRGPVKLIPPERVCPPGPCGHEVPGPVSDLSDLAWGLGWQRERHHSRGGVMGGNGKQLAPAELWSVRFRRGSWAGYAVRRGELWDSVCITGRGLHPFLALGMTDLRQWLADPEKPDGVELGAWVAGISKRVRDQGLASKQVRCPGPGECAWVDEGRGDHTHRANGDVKVKKSRKEAVSGA